MSELEDRHYLGSGGETLPDAREALEWAAETGVWMVDFRFVDLLGTWQHTSKTLRDVDEEPSRTASASTVPRSAASRRSTSPTC